MNKSSKLILGMLSFLPFIMMCIIISMVFSLLPQIIEWSDHEPEARDVFSTFSPIFIAGLVMAFASLALLVIFIIHLANNRKIETGEKLIWILIFLFVSIIGYPIYWWLRIWNEDAKF